MMNKAVCRASLWGALLLLTLTLLCTSVGAETEGLYTYTVRNGEATITACYTSAQGNIVIPSTLGGYPVTAIGTEAFHDRGNIASIVIPDGVRVVADRAFINCAGLNWISLPQSLVEIGEEAFRNCQLLKSVTLPRSLTKLGKGAFYDCNRIRELIFEDDSALTAINDQTFYHCDNLQTLTFGKNSKIEAIGKNAFTDCVFLLDLQFPQTLRSIGSYAFAGCERLRSMSFAEGCELLSIGTSAFAECIALPRVQLPAKTTNIGSYTFYGCRMLEYVTFEGGSALTEIGSYAFHGCTLLLELSIPNGVRFVGEEAFTGCVELLQLENNVWYVDNWVVKYDTKSAKFALRAGTRGIADRAFFDCNTLATVSIPDSLQCIGRRAFASCSDLLQLNLPAELAVIGDNAFSGTTSLQRISVHENNPTYFSCSAGILYTRTSPAAFVHVPADLSGEVSIVDGISQLPSGTLANRKNLTRVNLPASVGSVSSGTFSGCTSLREIVVDGANQSYASVDGILYNKALTAIVHIPKDIRGSVHIPKGVTSLPSSAFSGAVRLTDVELPSTLQSIGGNAFSGCTSLSTLTVPSGVRNIGRNAFSGCKNLTRVEMPTVGSAMSSLFNTMPSKLETIVINGGSTLSSGAFAQCTALKEITLAATVTRIPDNAFEGCSKLERLIVAQDNPSYMSVDGILYNKPATRFVHIPHMLKGDVTIPHGITTIASYQFDGYDELTLVILPGSLTHIGEGAFWGCISLRTLSIPENVTTIGAYAFANCSAAKTLSIACKTPPSLANTSLNGTDLEQITVPKGCADAYRAAKNWVKYANCIVEGRTAGLYDGRDGTLLTDWATLVSDGRIVVEEARLLRVDADLSGMLLVADGITGIAKDAFSGCTALCGIELPVSVAVIEQNPFRLCDALQYVSVHENNASYAIVGQSLVDLECKKLIAALGAAEIPADGSVTAIGAYAFYGSDIQRLFVPAAVTEIDAYAFANCRQLSEIVADAVHPIYHTQDNCLIATASKTVVLGCRTSVLPQNQSVKAIGAYAFAGSCGLSELTIPAGVEIIGEGAFADCPDLWALTLEEGAVPVTVCANAFAGTPLSTLSVPYGTAEAYRAQLPEEYAALVNEREHNHTTTELRDQRDASCTAEGYTGDVYCVDCQALLTKGQKLPVFGHTYDQAVVSEQYFYCAASCLSGAKYRYSCVCGKAGEQTFTHGEPDRSVHLHTTLQGALQPTATTDGYTGDEVCADCGNVLSRGTVLDHPGSDIPATNQSNQLLIGVAVVVALLCAAAIVVKRKKNG